LLDTLIDRYVATAVPVVSSRYADGIIGPPTLFDIDTEADRCAM
jgi:hypothetical protein